jgi:hypothetical protein
MPKIALGQSPNPDDCSGNGNHRTTTTALEHDHTFMPRWVRPASVNWSVGLDVHHRAADGKRGRPRHGASDEPDTNADPPTCVTLHKDDQQQSNAEESDRGEVHAPARTPITQRPIAVIGSPSLDEQLTRPKPTAADQHYADGGIQSHRQTPDPAGK